MEAKLNIAHTVGEGNTLTVLEGAALEQKEPNKVLIAGDIHSVSAFISKRKITVPGDNGELLPAFISDNFQIIDINRSIIYVDKFNQIITLDVDPQDFYGPIVKGSLEESEELKPFNINKGSTFKKDALVKLLRFSRRYFDDNEKYSSLLLSYQSFSAKAHIEMKNEADERGNKHQNYQKKVETALPVDFILNMPIFKGQPEERFRVEICLDVTDGGASFWFESVELHERIQMRIEEIFKDQLTGCDDFVIINK